MVNPVGDGLAFGTPDNRAVVLTADGGEVEVPPGPKAALAATVWDLVLPAWPDYQLVGLPGTYSQTRKSRSSCVPEIRSASATSSGVLVLPYRWICAHALSSRKNARSPIRTRSACRVPDRSSAPGQDGVVRARR